VLRTGLLVLLCFSLFSPANSVQADAAPLQPVQGAATPSAQEIEAALLLAEQGDAAAQNYLGFLYATGKGVKKDDQAAFNWFRKAADQNHPEALGNLAVMHEKGLGIEKNLSAALSLHRQAAMAGYPLSMKRLATLYETGVLGEAPDPLKAEMWKNRYQATLNPAPPAADKPVPRQTLEKSPTPLPAEKPAQLAVAKAAEEPPPRTSPPAQPAKPPERPAAAPAIPPPAVKPAITPRPAVKATQKPAKPPVPAQTALIPEPPLPAAPTATPDEGEVSSRASGRHAEISGKADAREVPKLIRDIADRGLLPKNMSIELLSPDTGSYRLRIGPFPSGEDAAAHAEKIRVFLSPPAPAPAPTPAHDEQELVPAQATQATPAASPAAPRAAETPASRGARSAPADEKPAASSARGRFYFVNINAVNTIKDSLFLAQLLFTKQLVQESRRVKIENLDGQIFQVSIGPFRNAAEASQEAQTISQQTFLQSSVAVFERYGAVEGGEGQHFVQLNTQGTLENALSTTQALAAKGFLAPALSAEIVNFGSGNYRVRLGPYRGLNEASHSAAKLKTQFNIHPLVLNLDRLVPTSGK
jgi:hypothetical protein